MDILVNRGEFLFPLLDFSCLHTKPDESGGISVWADEPRHISIQTGYGDFVEVVATDGSVLVEGGDGNYLSAVVGPEPVAVRVKELPDPKLPPKKLDAYRRKVTRYLFSDSPYDLPDKLTDVIEWMKAKLGEIPEGCRESARLSFGNDTQYGETYPRIEITYSEPESDQEVIRRVQVDIERAHILRRAEKAELKRLKEIFEKDA